MSDNGKTGVLMIKTAEKQEDIIGSGMVTLNMRLNLDRVDNECRYIICCQDNSEDNAELFTDNSAYLVGIIRDTRKLPNGSAVIYLSDFSTLYREDMWTKRQGVQVQYFSTLRESGIPGRVNFKSLGTTPVATIENAATEIMPPGQSAVALANPKSILPTADFRTNLATCLSIKPKNVESAVIVLKLDDGTKVTLEL